MTRLRACCVAHSPVGCAVTPSTWTRRLATSSTNRTYNRCKNTVSTVKKSTASTPLAWARGTAARRSPSASVPGRRRRGAGWPIPCWPRSYCRGGTAHRGCGGSPSSGSPGPGSTSARTSGEVLGRPRRCGYVRRPRTRSRCQRSSVSGRTNDPRRLRRGSSRASPASTARSAQSSRGRVTGRRSTATSWRSINSSASFAAELRASSVSHPITWQNIVAPCILGRTCSSTHPTEFRAPTTPGVRHPLQRPPSPPGTRTGTAGSTRRPECRPRRPAKQGASTRPAQRTPPRIPSTNCMNEFRHPTGHHTLTAPPPTDPNPVPDSAPGATRTTNLVSHLRIDKTAPMTSEMIPIVSRIARLAMKPMTSRINRHEHAAASAGPPGSRRSVVMSG